MGRTALRVTEIGLGIGRIGRWRNTPHDDAVAVVQRALELGINYIDTAPYYSNAQELLGEALQYLLKNRVDNLNIHDGDWYAYWQPLDPHLRDPYLSLDADYDSRNH